MIPNDVLEALSRVRVPGEARQVLDVIIRQTWGWKRESDAISLKQFEEKTGLDRGSVGRALRALKSMNLILVDTRGGKKATVGVAKMPPLASIYGINKDITTWKPLERVKRGGGKKATGNGQKAVAKMPPTKERSLKKVLKKEYTPDSVEYRLALLFFEGLEKINYPWPKGRKPNLQAWADEFRKLIEIDGRQVKEIEALLSWIRGSWWADKILTPSSLRGKTRDGAEKWATLIMQMRDRNGRSNGSTGVSAQTKQRWYFCSCGRSWSKQQRDTRYCECGRMAETRLLEERDVLELQRSERKGAS